MTAAPGASTRIALLHWSGVDLDSYIARHRPEWDALESALSRSFRGGLAGPDMTELVRLYLRASSHLAEVQSRYHDPAVVEYLNGLVTRAQGAIYGTETRTLRAGLALFGGRYRQALRRTTSHILVITALLLGTGLATGIWVAVSPEARAGVLPPAAQSAVEEADGSSDLAEFGGAEVSTYIFQNNVRVAFLAFALGITLAIGTLFVVVQNAILVGLLAGAFTAGGKADVFWSLVLPHGFLEIMAICIAGGAGLRIGWAMVDPGDRPRAVALQEEATDAVLVVIGVIPAFAIAALIEGFVTGRTGFALLEVGLGATVALAYLVFLFGGRTRVRAAPAP